MGLFSRIADALFPNTERAKKRRRGKTRPNTTRQTDTPPPGEPFGTGYDPDSEQHWQVVRWTGSGGDTRWRSVEDGDRLTRDKLTKADQVVIAVYPPGATEPLYRTFRGPVQDINRTIQYWLDVESI